MNANNIRKLPKSVQSLISASNQINTYTKAVQELVFNALDADATSIAVRINIADGSIQVVDNGFGVSPADYKYIGQKYMTSKLVDICNLKSAPNKYGFQGQSLAKLTQISEILKVTSRFYKRETTYEKIFEKGKAKSIAKCSPRPSKGTTVEIKGFLYNLSIQKKSVNLINELQSIKIFLEHISLVHSSISLSLRDDSKNEIVYKMHKNRDIYQTLTTLYGIEKTNVQELQVEKNQYKVIAYVGKRDVQIRKQIIFLNGKFLSDSSLIHKKVNENFEKQLKADKNKTKKNLNNDEENHVFVHKIPFYFIFIKCPYLDYELTNTVLEFKDWGQINTILDKLVKFYIGDIPLQKFPKKQIKRLGYKQETESTRYHIEKLMQKILGNQCKKPGISQMQNGIKGKMIRRKLKDKKSMLKSLDPDKNKKRKEISKQGSRNKTLKDSILQIRSKNKYKNKQEGSLITALSKTYVDTLNKGKISKKLTPKRKIKPAKQLCRNNLIKATKPINEACFKKVSLNDKFAMETESVKMRCKLLAQKAEIFIKNNNKSPEVFLNENVQYTSRNFLNNNENIAVHTKVNEIVIHEYIPLPKKSNNDRQAGNYGTNTLFKSNYDLLQTIISSHQGSINLGQWITQGQENINPLVSNIKETSEPPVKVAKADRYRVPSFMEENDPAPFEPEILDFSSRGFVRESDEIRAPDTNLRLFSEEYKNTTFLQETRSDRYRRQVRESDDHNIYQLGTPDYNISPFFPEAGSISSLQVDTLDSNIRPYLMKTSDYTSPIPVTFQSHHYEQNFHKESDIYNFHKKPRNFIRTQSRENFITFPENIRLETNKINLISKLSKSKPLNHEKRARSTKIFNVGNNTTKDVRESYTIEFNESNEYEYTSRNNNSNRHDSLSSTNKTNLESIKEITPSMNYIFNHPYYRFDPPEDLKSLHISINNNKDSDLDYEPLNRNTYIITNSYRDINLPISFNHEDWNHDVTYTIENINKLCYTSDKPKTTQYPNDHANKETKFVSVSKSQEDVNEDGEREITNPVDVCETVLSDHELSIDRELQFDINFNCKLDSLNNFIAYSNDTNDMGDTLNNDNMSINFSQNISCEKNNTTEILNQEVFTETSHHFTIPNSNMCKKQSPKQIQRHGPTSKAEYNEKTISNEQNPAEQRRDTTIVNEYVRENDTAAFTINNRMYFVPKGMSSIFKECQTKLDCKYGPKADYYADKIYNDFVDKVQNETEIFKPRIRGTNELTTKDISKVSKKLNKDNASLKFDGICIKNATVLGQVDSKFIAATMKSKSNEEFLVLFDQHAVHERIRLENNLAYYLNGSQWKSVTIDEVSIKMSRDDILYLHNYRDKFTQFGLQWNILNNKEISITAIPEGILGKNPRQVDRIIKAVKNLITEEINIIQMQRGCVSLYPKSIMDLVFSEACRYAIKFGDHLSKSQCIELLKGLSECKTPFQCAHGRPDMAVIMNIECIYAEYKINFKKIKKFKIN